MSSQRIGWLIGLGSLTLALLALFLFNPAEHAFFPQCYFHRATGLQCPGCGGLRAMHQLLHGHVLTALRLNAFAVLLLPLLAVIGWREFVRYSRENPKPRQVRSWWIWAFVGLLLLFSVLRNLPAFAFLAP